MARDWGTGSVGGGATGASPESAEAIDAGRDRRSVPPDEDPTPRPGCLRTVLAIIAVLVGAALLVYLVGLAVDLLLLR